MYRIEVSGTMKGKNYELDKKRKEKSSWQRSKGRLIADMGKKNWRKGYQYMKKKIWKKKALSSIDYSALCIKSKAAEGPLQKLTAHLCSLADRSEASAEICISSIHFNRSTRIVNSLVDWHSKMSFWGMQPASPLWKGTLVTHTICLCSWAILSVV